jgi:hypothetical protein
VHADTAAADSHADTNSDANPVAEPDRRSLALAHSHGHRPTVPLADADPYRQPDGLADPDDDGQPDDDADPDANRLTDGQPDDDADSDTHRLTDPEPDSDDESHHHADAHVHGGPAADADADTEGSLREAAPGREDEALRDRVHEDHGREPLEGRIRRLVEREDVGAAASARRAGVRR